MCSAGSRIGLEVKGAKETLSQSCRVDNPKRERWLFLSSHNTKRALSILLSLHMHKQGFDVLKSGRRLMFASDVCFCQW